MTDIKIEKFSLRRALPQFREFNSAVKKNRARLEPYFWWARTNGLARFKFILSGLIAEKISHILRELPYNKKFIIRANGKFAGVIGLDGMAQNAPRAEVWYFITDENEGQHIASKALGQIEVFAQNQSIERIYARTLRNNRKSQYLLDRHGFHHYYPSNYTRKNRDTVMWYKYLGDKVIEK